MVIVGNHDTRVMPMHPFKFAAALQMPRPARYLRC
jgi:prolyl oligopeptidase PreP (S9A serine peptidase family)